MKIRNHDVAMQIIIIIADLITAYVTYITH